MAKAKTKIEDNTEEEALLSKLNGRDNSKSDVSMPFLAMNIASEDDEGNEIPVKTFHLSGTKLYSKTIRFRPLAFKNKLITMKQQGKDWKTLNETIFYNVGEQPLDARGGIACGRLLGKAVPDHWNEAEVKVNKAKATFYGFLFGLVEFPGEKPVLCNFRVPGGKAVQIGTVLRDLADNHEGFARYMLNLKLASNPKDKSSPHPILEIEPDMSTVLPVSGIKDHLNSILEFVDTHNKRIRDSHASVKLARQETKEDSALLDDLDDNIPF